MATTQNYITPQTDNGLKVLNHFRTQCNKALAYCKKQGLTDIKDFAAAVETISEQENPALKIATETNRNGITLWLAQSPQFGTTTGKYMMQHLGEGNTNRFTRQGIEQSLGIPNRGQNQGIDPAIAEALNSNQQQEQNEQVDVALNNLSGGEEILEEDDDIFSDGGDEEAETELEGDLLNTQEQEQEQDDLIDDDLLQIGAEARNKPSSYRKKPPQNKKPQPPNKGKGILKQASEASAAATSGSEVDGLSIAGLTGQAATLVALIGEKKAKELYATLKQVGQEHRLNKIASRLEKNFERAEQLSERGEALTSQFDTQGTTNTDSPGPKIQQNEDEEENQSPTEVLGKVVNKLEDRINQNPINADKHQESNPRNVVDRNADISEQLDQIETALSRIEDRLEQLEQRIEALEESLQNEVPKSEKKIESLADDHPEDPNNSESDNSNHDSNDNAKQTATALREIYQTEGVFREDVDDGIPLGQTAILYANEDETNAVVTIESNDGEELFAATKQGNEEWNVEADELNDQEKQQIIDQGQEAKSVREQVLNQNQEKSSSSKVSSNQIEV